PLGQGVAVHRVEAVVQERVVKDQAGTVTVVGADGLQQKGNRDYFHAAVGLPEGAVLVSPIDLNVEHDRIELPPRPTLRAALPVRNDRGEVFAVVVVNVLTKPLLDLIGGESGLPDVQEWVTDAAGHYLWHPQPGKAFAHLLNPPGTTWQEEFTPAPDAVRPAGLPADAKVLRAPDGADWLIFTRTLRAPGADGTGGVVLHSGIPLQVLAARAWEGVSGHVILVWAMGFVVIGLGTLLLVRWERLTRSESAVAAAADDPAERRAWYVGAGVAVVVLLLGGGGWWFVRGQLLAEAREDSFFRAELVGQYLKITLQSAARSARVLAELRPDTLSSQAEFERRAADLNGVTPETLVLQWSPQAIVRFSQPLAGNERAIGLDLRADPRVRDLIARTIQTGQPFWDGPFLLRQGGLGMVYRVPVYRPGAPVSEQDFLGLATCLVNLNEIAGRVATSRPLFHFAASVQSGGAAPVDILPAEPGAVAATAATAEVSLALDPSDTLAADTVRFKVTAALKDPPVGGHWLALAGISLLAALFGSLAHVMETRRAGRHRLLQLSARLERSAQAVKVGFWEYELATRKISWSAEMFEFRGITEGEFDGTLDAAVQFDRAMRDLALLRQRQRWLHRRPLQVRQGDRSAQPLRSAVFALHQSRACLDRRAIGQEEPREARVAGDVRRGVGGAVLQVGRRDEAALGQPDRRCHDVGEREAAEALERRAPAQQRARHRDGERAHGVLAALRLAVVRQLVRDRLVHVGARRAGRGAQPVEHDMGAVGEADMRDAAAQHADHHRLHHGQREERGDRGVDGVATGEQHLRAGSRGERMVGDDHAARPGRGLLLAGEWRRPRRTACVGHVLSPRCDGCARAAAGAQAPAACFFS
ncbi:MAG: hypothetical protein RLZZ221_2390, partial [Verrucomicrobiota bacterium]